MRERVASRATAKGRQLPAASSSARWDASAASVEVVIAATGLRVTASAEIARIAGIGRGRSRGRTGPSVATVPSGVTGRKASAADGAVVRAAAMADRRAATTLHAVIVRLGIGRGMTAKTAATGYGPMMAAARIASIADREPMRGVTATGVRVFRIAASGAMIAGHVMRGLARAGLTWRAASVRPSVASASHARSMVRRVMATDRAVRAAKAKASRPVATARVSTVTASRAASMASAAVKASGSRVRLATTIAESVVVPVPRGVASMEAIVTASGRKADAASMVRVVKAGPKESVVAIAEASGHVIMAAARSGTAPVPLARVGVPTFVSPVVVVATGAVAMTGVRHDAMPTAGDRDKSG